MKIISPNHNRGFSLLEMLLFISVLGIIVALVLPFFGSHKGSFENARAKRNAKELISVCTAAQVAGIKMVVPGDLDETVKKLVAGATPDRGVLKGRIFKVNLVNEDDLLGAQRFLTIENGELLYRGDA